MWLAITVLGSLVGLGPVSAQSSCYLASVKPAYPDVVPAGQHFQVSTTVSASCSGAADPFNDIRVDLIDAHAQNQPAILSSNKYSWSLLSAQSVTATITNDVIAPSETGTWVLQVEAYVIGRPSGTALASSHQLFNVQVVPYTPTSTTSSVTTTSSITTTTSLTTKSVTSATSQQVILPTSTLTTTYTPSGSARQDNSTYYAALFILLIAVIGIIVVLRRKKRDVKEKTRMWDVNPQGSSAVGLW